MSSYLQLKKRAFMSIVNVVKGFVRTVSGVPPLTLDDCVDSDSLIDYKIYGNSFQDGTPSPENSIPVVSVGEYDSVTGKYKIPVTARGKNLVDIPYINANTTDTIINCNLTETITLSMNAESVEISKTIWRIRFKYKDGTLVYFADGNVNKTIQSSKENPIIEIYYRGQYITAGSYNNIMIEYGTTATEYEPYHEPIQTNIYLDEPLRAQYHLKEKRWYYDEIDFKTNILIRNLSEKTFVGTANENWKFSKETDSKIHFYIGGISNNCSFGSTPESAMCDKFVGSYTNATTSNSLEGFSVAYTTSMAYIGIFKSRLTDAGLTVDLDGFKTWLSQNPVTITYILKEPIEETISLPKLPTIKGTTIYEIGTSLNASNMEATYYSTIHNS